MTKITIAICTYNGESRLPKVFDYLAKQVEIQPEDWEILVVDNASKDRTSEIVAEYQTVFSEICNIRYVFEKKQGLAFARARAVKEANSALVGFVDDDNLLFSDWINQAITFAESHPKVGAFGGQIHGKFESPPPAYLKKIQFSLAIVERGNVAHEYTLKKRMLPPGAGLVVRKQIWSAHVPDVLSLSGRVGDSMLAGEDLEALAYIQKAGWEIWYNPAMELDHDIPQHRLQKEYLLKMAWGMGLCKHQIRMGRYGLGKKIFLTPLHLMNDFNKLLRYAIFVTKHNADDEIIQKFELIYRLSTFISPFYALKSYWKLRLG